MPGYNFTVNTPDATNVTQNSKAIITIPVVNGHTFLKTALIFKKADGSLLTQAEILSNTGEYVAKINGKKIYDADTEFMAYLMKKRNGADSVASPDGLLEIYYQRNDVATDVARELTGWGMQNVYSFTMEIEVTGMLLKQIEVKHRVTPQGRPFVTHLSIERHREEVTSTGKKIYQSMPYDRNANENLLELIVRKNDGEIGDTACKVGTIWVKETGSAWLDEYWDATARKVEQSGYYTFSFNNNRSPLGVLPLRNKKVFQQEVEWTTMPPSKQVDFFLLKIQNLNVKPAA